jgi:zinc protease
LLQAIGNNSNAYTTDDHNEYFINTTPEHLDKAVDLVTGYMLTATITEAEYKREFQVVQRELEMNKGQPDSVFYELCQRNRYRVSPARVPVIGYQEVIQGLSRNDVYNYYKLAYQPNNMIFAIAGDVEPEQMLRTVQKYVADARPGREFSHDIQIEPPVLVPRTTVATFPKLGQARVQLAFPSVRLSDPDLFALDLLSKLLGGGERSILVQKIRDEQQLVSDISCWNPTPAYDAGSFQIYINLDTSNLTKATDAVLALLEQVRKDGLNAERVERAKRQMKADRLRSLQTAEEIASSLAGDYLSPGDPHFTDRYLERIDKLTPEDVNRAARKYLDAGKLIKTVLLPAEAVAGLPKAEDLLRTEKAREKAAPRAAEEVDRTVLPNGTVLLVKRVATSPVVSIQMYARGGVTVEDESNNGIGNFTMSLLPRGTKTRSATDIAEFFDSTGGSIDCAGENNTWLWKVECLSSELDRSLEVFADVVLHPAFDPKEVDQMRPRILAGIDSVDADWTSQAMRFFKQSYYGSKHSPYRFLTIGSRASIEKLSAESIQQWYEQMVIQAPRVIAIYGDIDAAKVKERASNLLKDLPKTNGPSDEARTYEPLKPSDEKPHIRVDRVETQKTEQALAGIVIGFNSGSRIGDPANDPIDVADTVTSGWGYPTGYLFDALRGKGLVYVVHAQNMPGRNNSLSGTFMVYAGCDPGKVDEVIAIILENIARLQGRPADIGEKWFVRSKQLIQIAEAIGQQTSAEQAATAAIDELYGLGFDFHRHYADRIQAVEIGQVQRVAGQRLDSCVITVSTPDPSAVKIKSGTRTYDSFEPVDLTPRGVQHDAGKSN